MHTCIFTLSFSTPFLPQYAFIRLSTFQSASVRSSAPLSTPFGRAPTYGYLKIDKDFQTVRHKWEYVRTKREDEQFMQHPLAIQPYNDFEPGTDLQRSRHKASTGTTTLVHLLTYRTYEHFF